MAARRASRRGIGYDIDPEYVLIAEDRLQQATMLLWLSNRVLVGCEAGEPLLVLGGEVVVVAAASFELGEEGGVGLERLGGVGEGDVGLLA